MFDIVEIPQKLDAVVAAEILGGFLTGQSITTGKLIDAYNNIIYNISRFSKHRIHPFVIVFQG